VAPGHVRGRYVRDGVRLPQFSQSAGSVRQHTQRQPSVQRCRDREDYLGRVRAAAERLVADRYLLAEDVETLLELAGERYDAFAGSPAERCVVRAGARPG
jgi:hypothetical protein